MTRTQHSENLTFWWRIKRGYTPTGQLNKAHAALGERLAFVSKEDERCDEADLHCLKSELLLAESPDEGAAAVDCFAFPVNCNF